MSAQCERLLESKNNQEVGLEAATLERVRNSSLVEGSCADNVTGLKHFTEAADRCPLRAPVVGERRGSVEVGAEAPVERPRVRMPG